MVRGLSLPVAGFPAPAALGRGVLLGLLLWLPCALEPASARADEPVSIVVEEPVEGAVVAGRFTVRGRVVGAADDHGLLRIHGQDVVRQDGAFTVELAPSTEGALRIRILFAEIGRPAMTLERPVVVDWSPPIIDVREPAEPDSVHPDGDVEIQGVVRDPHLAELRMNGALVRVGSAGQFDATFLLPAEGELRVLLSALDRAGNRAEVARVMRTRAASAGPAKPPAPTAPSVPPVPPVPLAPTVPPGSPVSPVPAAASGPRPGAAALLEAALAQPLPARDWPKVQPASFMARLHRKQGLTRGRTPEADRSVAEALLWLAAHQALDGGWSSDGFGRICDGAATTQPPVEGAGESGYDTGVTALALCAFLGAGHTHRRPGPFARTLARGLSWLRTRQDGQGCISTRARPGWMYEHAWAYVALLEAYALTGDPELLEPCGRARDFCMQARNPGAGWGYGVRTGKSEVFLTLLMDQCHETSRILANASINGSDSLYAQLAWHQTAEQQFEPSDWVLQHFDPRSGRIGYDVPGGWPYRPADRAALFPAKRSASLTAARLAMEVLRGFTDAEFKSSFELLRRMPPRWSREEGTIDFFTWTYGAAALATLDHPAWKTWSAALHKDVLPHQRSDGDWCGYRGSWDPVDAFGREGGRVVSTALMAMVFASYDRYAPEYP